MTTLPKRLIILFLTAFLTLIAAQGLALADAGSPMSYIKEREKKVMAILQKPRAARDADLRALIDASIDYDDLAQRSLGKHWPSLSPEQQTRYKTTFREMLDLTYVTRLGDRSPENNHEIEWESEKTKGDTGRVLVLVLYEDTETEVEFVLKKKSGAWMIHDVAYDGASVEATYQKNYGKILTEKGFDELIKKMDERVAELRKEKAKKKL